MSDTNIIKDNKWNILTLEEKRIIENKGTELPFSGKYDKHYAKGYYICKRCDAKLYSSESKFNSSCGWPSFDDEIDGAVKRVLDSDGRRTEILCNNCDAHLGHVFTGENFTKKNTRHCVNSASMKFVSVDNIKKAYFAAGCFWGVEYYFQNQKGVLSTSVGYMGGDKKNPSYKDVSRGSSGHLEAIEVEYDSAIISYEDLLKLFFEIHDYTQSNGQGPDIGSQYLSAVFYSDKGEETSFEKLKNKLSKGKKVATKLLKKSDFWQAEDYHQDYYKKHKKIPYCHFRKKIKWD